MLVKGVTKEIFEKLKDYVTIFPRDTSRLLININTAPEIVIRALGRSVSGPSTNTDVQDADSMAWKVVTYRKGDDGKEFTADDRYVNLNELGLNAKERTIFLSAKTYMADSSNYLRIGVKGTDQKSGVESDIETIVYRDDLSVLYWYRN